MTVITLLPLLVAAIGLVVYLVASKPEAKEIGRLAFACGLLAWLLLNGREALTIRV